MSRRRLSPGAVALVALAFLAPPALAADGALGLATTDPVALEGRLTATLDGAQATFESGLRTFDAAFRGLRGQVTVYEWRETSGPVVAQPHAEPTQTRHEVNGATLAWTARGEEASFRLAATNGTVTVTADVADEGRFGRFGRVAVREVVTPWPLPTRPAQVPIRWEPEWRALGNVAPDHLDMQPFPQVTHATLGARGEASFMVWGGNVTFTDAQGRAHAVRTGAWASPSPLYPGTPAAHELTYVLLRYDGEVAAADLPLTGGWGVAAPEYALRLDGGVTWRHATGEATVGGARRAFQDATVALDLDGDVLATPPLAGPAAEYASSGEFRALRIDGATLASPPAAPPYAAPAAVTVAALLLFALTKLGQSLLAAGAASLYTRLTPSDVLAHPQRRRIHDEVTATPGVHQRELHRRVGGAWGPFAFHLRTLAKAGHVRLARQGAYTLVFPATGPVAPASAIPHPVARAVFDALPEDGSPVPMMDLAARVGASRELVAYHLRGLEARGLVRRVPLGGARRGVARAQAVEPPASGA